MSWLDEINEQVSSSLVAFIPAVVADSSHLCCFQHLNVIFSISNSLPVKETSLLAIFSFLFLSAAANLINCASSLSPLRSFWILSAFALLSISAMPSSSSHPPPQSC